MKLNEHFKFHDMVKELSEKVGLFDSDIDYIIKDDKLKNSYVVTSWTTGKAPKNVYTVSKAGNKWSCNCPTKTSYCKHIDMVKEWIKDGKPNPLIDKDTDNDFAKLLKKIRS